MSQKDKSLDNASSQGEPPPRTIRDLSPMKVLLLFVVALGVLYYIAGNLPHDRVPPAVAFRTSVEQASQQAKESGKVIFADFYADWCAPCRAMDKDIFSRKDFAASLERIAVPLRVDLDTDAGSALATRYHVQTIPAYIVLHPDGRPIARVDSGATAQDLLDFVQRAAQKAHSDRP